MDRRTFMGCLACGCASGVLGCTTRRDGEALSQREADADTLSTLDWDIAVCGLNCAKCGARKKGECAGCRGSFEQQCWADCPFRPCAEAKGLRYCFECDGFPCDKVEAFAADEWDHHRATVENMKKMKAMGLKNWGAQQPKPVWCPGLK